MIRFFAEDTEFKMDAKTPMKVRIARLLVAESRRPGELCVVFCSDSYLLDINIKFLSHDWLTDVITFDYSHHRTVSGDIFISIDRVRENAKTFGVGFDEELRRVIYHGVLHLCGYGDKSPTEQRIMRKKEKLYLKLL